MALMPDAIKQQIKALWIEGKTGGQIAEIIGITRNSVMGAIHRMKAKGEELPLKAPHMPRQKLSKPRAAPTKTKPAAAQIHERSVLEMAFDFPDNHITIMALKRDSCRYIVVQGDVAETRYCGQSVSKGSLSGGANSPYCRTHHKLCYQPAR